MSGSKKKVRVGISVGDYNGIGIEIILKTFNDSRMLDFCTPIIYGSSKVFSFHKKKLELEDIHFNVVKDAAQYNPKKNNLVDCCKDDVKIELGQSTATAGKYAYTSLKKATEDIASNKIDVLVTAPINKNNIQSEEFNFSGHTEYLAHYANEENPLMVMVAGNLRVGLVSGHIPIKQVASTISKDLILKKLDLFTRTLIQDFGIRKPKVAVLGLNPHAGDNGYLGSEEEEIIIPAIQQANSSGILAFGPYPADGLFGSKSLYHFDGILAMYHDQGLSPFKALVFEDGVNYTAGLPIVRTSPDHGVAYDIAGKNQASESSFRQAVYLACDVFKTRRSYKNLVATSLVSQKKPVPES